MKQINIALGIVGGVIIGASAALLLTPESGEDMRKTIQKNYKDLNETAQKEIMSLRKEFNNLNKKNKKDLEVLTKKITELGKKIIQK